MFDALQSTAPAGLDNDVALKDPDVISATLMMECPALSVQFITTCLLPVAGRLMSAGKQLSFQSDILCGVPLPDGKYTAVLTSSALKLKPTVSPASLTAVVCVDLSFGLNNGNSKVAGSASSFTGTMEGLLASHDTP